MRHKLLAGVMLAAAASAIAADKDSVTINGVTFDFGAPAPPLTTAQKDFYERYSEAVNRRDAAALLTLQDESHATCANDGSKILFREFRHTIPQNAKVRFFPLTTDFAKLFGAEDLFYLPVQPTAILGISYGSSTKEAINLVQIFQPVRQTGQSITLVPYCLTDKGKSMVH